MKENLGVHEDDRGYPRIDKVNYLPERIELRDKTEKEENSCIGLNF